MRYKGKTPVKPRDQVYLMVDGDIYETARVCDALATQFTIMKRGRVRYFFYEDKGFTWKPVA